MDATLGAFAEGVNVFMGKRRVYALGIRWIDYNRSLRRSRSGSWYSVMPCYYNMLMTLIKRELKSGKRGLATMLGGFLTSIVGLALAANEANLGQVLFLVGAAIIAAGMVRIFVLLVSRSFRESDD